MSEKEKVLFVVLAELVEKEVLDPVVAEEFWEGRHYV